MGPVRATPVQGPFMTDQPGPDLPGALAALAAAFRDLDRPAMLIGGLAAIARGIPRQTIDIGRWPCARRSPPS